MEVRESVEVCEEARLASLDQVPCSDVEQDNPGVRGSEFGRELPVDVVAVSVEFGSTVGKDEADGLRSEPPG